MSPLRRVAHAVVVALVTTLPALPAFAQQDDGWFDKPQAAPAPAAPAPAGADKPALAPSPLLEQDAAPAAEDDSADRDPRALTYWNGHLAPYGVWVDDPSYGRVWVPHSHVVGADFAPYVSGGHWALDENDDWIWVSDYPFGGVTFHYGRWVWISGRGWAWIPGLRYAPAWVAWRTGSYGYVGWAPLPPAWVWFGGVSVVYGYGPYYPWVFCSSDYLFYPHVHHHIVRDHHRLTYAANHTRPYHRTTSAHPVAAPRSPTPREAHVPAAAVPRQRVRAERLATPASRRAEPLGARIPVGQRAGAGPTRSTGPTRAADRSPLLQGERAPAGRRDVSPGERRPPSAERRDVKPADRRAVTPSERRAPRVDTRPPPRTRAPAMPRERIKVDRPRTTPNRELRGAPRGGTRFNRR